MTEFTATREDILQLLERALQQKQPKEVIQRLQWLMHYAEHCSISETCRHFGIARSTFYRWLKRFNPSDLSTLTDSPKEKTIVFQRSLAFCKAKKPQHTISKRVTPVQKHGCLFCHVSSSLRPLWKRFGLLAVLLSVFMNLAFLFLFVLPGSALASSWGPALIVNTEAFQVIDDSDSSANIELRFGDSANEILRWDVGAARFQFTDDVHMEGNITGSGTIITDGAISTKANLTINSDSGGADAVLTFGNDAADETMRFSDSTNGFIFSDDVEVQGTLSGANMRIMGNVGIGTTSPNYFFQINATSGVHSLLQLTNATTGTSASDGGYIGFLDGETDLRINNLENSDMRFFTNNDEKVRIDSSGRMGIGSTAPTTELEVVGTMSGDSLFLQRAFSGAGLSDCDTANTSKLLWDATTGTFSCGTDQDTGGGGGDPNVDYYVRTAGDTMTGSLTVHGTISGSILSGGVLHIGSAADSYIMGNVGIGTTSPETSLDIQGGDILLDNNRHLRFEDTAGTNRDAMTWNSSDVMLFNNHVGDIQFMNSSVNTLYLEQTSNLVGIGTSTPSTKLEVVGTMSGDNLTVMSGASSYVLGSLGVGVETPGAQLEVRAKGTNSTHLLMHNAVGSNGNTSVWFRDTDTNPHTIFRVTGDYDNDNGGPYEVVVDQFGRLGIGDTSPQTKLDVAGGISGVTLKTTGAATFGSTVTIGGVTYTFPSDDGSASGKVLKTDGAGNLSWSADGGGGSTPNLDEVYAQSITDVNLTMEVDDTSGLTFNLNTTGDFALQDNGSLFATFGDDGITSFASAESATTADGIGDVYIGDELEVDGVAYFDTTIGSNNTSLDVTDGIPINVGGLTAAAYNAFSDSGGTPGLADLDSDDDLFIEGALEVDGNVQFDGTTVGIRGITYTFPADDGSASGRVLATDSAGNLTWTSATDTNTTYDAGQGLTLSSTTFSLNNARTGSTLDMTGNITTDANLTINEDNGAADAILTFGNDAAAETLRFSDTTNGFIFSDDVEAQGTLSGANLTIMKGADSYFMGELGIGTTNPTNILHISSSDTDVLLEDTDTSVILTLRNSVATPAADTLLGRVTFSGEDSASNHNVYARMSGYVTDDTSTSEDGYLTFETRKAGPLTEHARIISTGNFGIGETAPSTTLEVGGSMSGDTLTISSLKGCNTIDTNGAGVLSCGTDETSEGGGGGMGFDEAASYFVQDKGDTMTGALIIKTTAKNGSGALEVHAVEYQTGAYFFASGAAVLALDSYSKSTESGANPHIAFGYMGYFDMKLYRHGNKGTGELVLFSETDYMNAEQNIFRMTVGNATGPAYQENVFRVTNTGITYADGAYNSTGADYAEWFYSDDELVHGELVCIDTTKDNSVRRCANTADGNLMGVVSSKDQAAFIGNAFWDDNDQPENYYLIALLGQVKTLISNENGTIQPGDAVTSASDTGLGRLANPGESTVGIALESSADNDGTIKVLISRRNASLTVEKVEEKVQETVEELGIEDAIEQHMEDAVEKLSLPGGMRQDSDERLKIQVQTLENSLETINALRPVQYKFNPDYLGANPSLEDKYYFNFIAQEFQQVLPDSVYENDEGYLEIDTYALRPYMVGAIQELAAKVENLEQKMVAAEGAGSVLSIVDGAVSIQAGYHLLSTKEGKSQAMLTNIQGGVLGQVLVLQPQEGQNITLRMSKNLLLTKDFEMHSKGDLIVLLKVDEDRWVELTRTESKSAQLSDLFTGWKDGGFDEVDE